MNAKRAWEWGTNEYVCPNSVTILWCLSQKQPNAEVNESHILASEELSKLWKPGYHTQETKTNEMFWISHSWKRLGFLNEFGKNKMGQVGLKLVIKRFCVWLIVFLDICVPHLVANCCCNHLPKKISCFRAPIWFLVSKPS